MGDIEMEENRYRLLYHTRADIPGDLGLSLLLLTDDKKTLSLSIICESDIAKAIEMRSLKIKTTSKLLPEVVLEMLRTRGETSYELIIYGIKNGQYLSYIYDKETEQKFKIRVSDGILFALATDTPIFIDKELMEKQAGPFENSSIDKIGVPANSISTPLLEKVLQNCIEKENYREASTIQKELNLRKNNLKGKE